MSALTRRALVAMAGLLPLTGCTARATPPKPRLIPVGNRNAMFWTPFSGARYEECQSRIQHVNGAVGVSDIRLRFVGWALDSQTSGEVAAPNDLEVWASVEYPAGVIHPVTFVGADRGVVRGGESLDSDVMALKIPPGAVFHVRCLARAGSGGRYPFGALCKRGLDGYESGPTGALTTKVAGGDIGAGGYHSVYTASAVLGVPDRPAHGVVIFGDSITYGFDNGLSDDSPAGGDAAGRHGYLERALGGLGVNSLNLSAPGLTAFMPAAKPEIMVRRLAFVADVGDVVINTLGRNDWGAFWKSDTDLLLAQQKLSELFASAGLSTILATTLPWTDPTNHRFGGDAATQGVWRERYNAALRAGAAARPILDVAAAGEAAGGAWRDRTWQTDGTHLTIPGNAALAQAITPALKAVLDSVPAAAP